MNIARRIIKYIGVILLSLLGLVSVLILLLYIPGIQNKVKQIALPYVNEVTGLEVSVDRIHLKFPLNLNLKGVEVVQPQGDTLLRVGRLEVNVALGRLLRQEVKVRYLALEQVFLNYEDTLSGMELRLDAGELTASGAELDLERSMVDLSLLELEGGKVFFRLGESLPDTTESAALPWDVTLRKASLKALDLTLEGMGMGTIYAGGRELQLNRAHLLLEKQEVALNSLILDAGYCDMVMSDLPEEEEGHDTSAEVNAVDTAAWTVNVEHISLYNGRFSMKPALSIVSAETAAFPDQMEISALTLAIDSVYNRGNIIRGQIVNLTLQEGVTGLAISRLMGRVALDEQKTEVSGVVLETPDSRLTLDAALGSELTRLGNRTPLRVELQGKLGASDILLFLADGPAEIRELLQGRSLVLEVAGTGTVGDLNLQRFNVHLPDDFSLSARGMVTGLPDMEALAGHIALEAALKNGSLADGFLRPDTGMQRLYLPPLALRGELALDSGAMALQLGLLPERGELLLDASYNIPDSTYRANLRLQEFGLEGFLPRDSVGGLSLTVALEGRGFSLPELRGELALTVDSLEYKALCYGGLTLGASLDRGVLNGRLKSTLPELLFDWGVHADITGGDYRVRLAGELRQADFHALGLVTDTLAVALGLDVKGELREDGFAALDAGITDIVLKSREGEQALGSITAHLKSGADSTRFRLNTGDLTLAFDSDMGRDSLLSGFENTASVLNAQLAAFDVDMEQLRREMPDFQLTLHASRNNLLNAYLAGSGLSFNQLEVVAEAPQQKNFKLRGKFKGLNYGSIKIDSLLLLLEQREKRLGFLTRFHNSTEGLDDFALFSVRGRAEGHTLELFTRELDKEDKPLIAMGMRLQRQDSAFVATINDTLILTYHTWTVNPGNYLKLQPGRMPEADIRLTGNNEEISFISGRMGGSGNPGGQEGGGSLQGRLVNLSLESLSRTFTLLPAMSGRLSAQVDVGNLQQLNAKGIVALDAFKYEGGAIGDVGLSATYRASSAGNRVEATARLDGAEILTLDGMLGDAERPDALDLQLRIPGLPLPPLEAFLPPEILTLAGKLVADLKVKGNTSAPWVDGSLHLAGASLQVIPIGTTFTVEEKPLLFQRSRIDFNQLGIVAPNKQRLELGGDLTFSDLSAIKTNLTLTARKFQLVNSRPNFVSMVDGKAYMDVNIRAQGLLDALRIRGDVTLLDNSEINYTMRNSPLTLTDRSEEMVRFVSFRDTLYVLPPRAVKTITESKTDLLVTLTVQPLVGVKVNLSDSGNDGVEFNGGGTLTFNSNQMGDMRLVGRYVISGGTVIYNVPVIGEKRFVIQQNNYAEWSGDLLDPDLNISAVETVSASETDEAGKNTTVIFNVIIRITGKLSKPQVEFDLSSQNSRYQNILTSMAAEERSRAALNLLITGIFTGPEGETTKSNSSNNALNTLLERELNNWMRQNVQGVELTFGIDSYEGGAGVGQRTDYSYQVSKRFMNDRIRVKIGGKVTTDNDPEAGGVEQSLVDDVSVEYLFNKNANFFLKIFRHTGYEDVLEGEVTRTGVGVVQRKNFERLSDIFRGRRKREERKRQEEMELNRMKEALLPETAEE